MIDEVTNYDISTHIARQRLIYFPLINPQNNHAVCFDIIGDDGLRFDSEY